MTAHRFFTRRTFVKAVPVSAMLGAGAVSAADVGPAQKPVSPDKRLPREVWIASISQNGLTARTSEQMIDKMLSRMREVVAYQPDIICLPEVFPFANLSGDRPPAKEVAEDPIGSVSGPFAEFARKHNCHVVCPIYARENGRCYNSAVFIDRQGRLLGKYHKIHPTIGEIDSGITPGPLRPPVFKTDFGLVGAQICFDIEWHDGWEALGQAGAEIVFWPSAFAGGAMVNTKAWENRYCVVSSTRKGTTKICDVTGQPVAWTGHFAHWVCAPVNLEKALLHTWPYCRRFKDIQAKYGRRIRITTFHEEEWSVIESRCPDVKVRDVLAEYELKTHREHIQQAHARQLETRPAV